MTTRERWGKILPIIQAFVEGKPIQIMGYSGRWEDCSTLSSMMHSEFRIKPDNLFKGVWSVDFTESTPGEIEGPIATGTMCWHGTNRDTPPWKFNSYKVGNKGTEKFEPYANTT